MLFCFVTSCPQIDVYTWTTVIVTGSECTKQNENFVCFTWSVGFEPDVMGVTLGTGGDKTIIFMKNYFNVESIVEFPSYKHLLPTT